MPNRIQELREEMHMTQVRLSIELGVSQETVCAYEKGKHYPSVAMLIRLSQIFHVSCDYILGLSDTRSAGTEVLSAQEQNCWRISVACRNCAKKSWRPIWMVFWPVTDREK